MKRRKFVCFFACTASPSPTATDEGGSIGGVCPCPGDLLPSRSHDFTFVFQSHVWRSTSKYSPVGQRTLASRVMPFSPASSHLFFVEIGVCFFFRFKVKSTTGISESVYRKRGRGVEGGFEGKCAQKVQSATGRKGHRFVACWFRGSSRKCKRSHASHYAVRESDSQRR